MSSLTLPVVVGQRFGRLVVQEELARGRGGKERRFRCTCDCGTERVAVGHNLRSGNTASCGCLYREVNAKKLVTHGARVGRRKPVEYEAWESMHRRCRATNRPDSHLYSGRGITVDPRWDSFADFLSDMGPRPSSKHSIDRIDNDAGYGPKNCKWSTPPEQSRNTRRNHLLTHLGETMCLTDWAAKAGITTHLLAGRIALGWSVEKALTEPIRSGPRRGQSPFS